MGQSPLSKEVRSKDDRRCDVVPPKNLPQLQLVESLRQGATMGIERSVKRVNGEKTVEMKMIKN